MFWKKYASLICLIIAITGATHSLYAMQEHTDYNTKLVQFVYNNKEEIAITLATIPIVFYAKPSTNKMPYIFSTRPCITVNCKNITVTLDTKETMKLCLIDCGLKQNL